MINSPITKEVLNRMFYKENHDGDERIVIDISDGSSYKKKTTPVPV